MTSPSLKSDPPKPAPEQAAEIERERLDHDLDEGLEETFPASDPVSITPDAD